MRFSKIKWNGKKAYMEWTTPNGEDQEVHNLPSTDEPRQGFIDALEAIAKHMPRLVGARVDYANSLSVTGVTLGQDPNTERRTFIFHCRKDVSSTGSAFNFTTPRIQEADPDLDEEDGKFLPEDAAKAVDRLIQEATAYVKGGRHQGELDLEGAGEEEEGAEGFAEGEEPQEGDEDWDQGPQYRVGEVPEEEEDDAAAEEMVAQAQRSQMAAVE